MKWYLKTDGAISAPTLVTSNQLLLAGSKEGNVYILKDKSNTLNKIKSELNLEWPTYLGNNQRTGDQQTVITDIEKNEETIYKFTLLQNFPNPFNPSTIISFSLYQESSVKFASIIFWVK